MIQQFFNGIATFLLAKFMLNDVGNVWEVDLSR